MLAASLRVVLGSANLDVRFAPSPPISPAFKGSPAPKCSRFNQGTAVSSAGALLSLSGAVEYTCKMKGRNVRDRQQFSLCGRVEIEEAPSFRRPLSLTLKLGEELALPTITLAPAFFSSAIIAVICRPQSHASPQITGLPPDVEETNHPHAPSPQGNLRCRWAVIRRGRKEARGDFLLCLCSFFRILCLTRCLMPILRRRCREINMTHTPISVRLSTPAVGALCPPSLSLVLRVSLPYTWYSHSREPLHFLRLKDLIAHADRRLPASKKAKRFFQTVWSAAHHTENLMFFRSHERAISLFITRQRHALTRDHHAA